MPQFPKSPHGGAALSPITTNVNRLQSASSLADDQRSEVKAQRLQSRQPLKIELNESVGGLAMLQWAAAARKLGHVRCIASDLGH